MADLTSLIERIEAATEGSRELDRLVARVAGWHRIEPRHMRNKHGGWIAPQDWIGKHSDGSPMLDSLHGTDIHREVPKFSTSISAARSIDPAALCVFASDIGADGLPMVKIVTDTSATPIIEHTGIAATLELAWCAAILRARQTEATND